MTRLLSGLVVTLTSHLLHFAVQLKQLVEELRYFATYEIQFDIQDEVRENHSTVVSTDNVRSYISTVFLARYLLIFPLQKFSKL